MLKFLIKSNYYICSIEVQCLEQSRLLSPVIGVKNGTDWLQAARVVDSLSYTFKNLEPGLSYRFRVRSENIYGSSKPGEASEVVYINENLIKVKNGETPNNTVASRCVGNFREKFQVLEELGRGRFGVVYKVKDLDDPNRILAAKIVKCIKSCDRLKVLKEISIMRLLQHPKLLHLATYFDNPKEIALVMEL